MTDAASRPVRLGLIGDTIATSKTPRLHRLAGAQNGIEVIYDLLVPKELGQDFDAVFETARQTGFRGVNVTYPYKELAARKVTIDDPLVRAIGAVNTVVFGEGAPRGFNTDYSGFAHAYRAVRGDAAPGVVCLIGAGGAGKAVAFALLKLGAAAIRCVDLDAPKAQALAKALKAAGTGTAIEVFTDPSAAAAGADGLINCTPLGMVGYGGTALPAEAMPGAVWAFDAVYTPIDTQFLTDAAAAGLTIISGYELFFGQGVDAWAIFTGLPLDPQALRKDLEGDAL